jgi:hypothetical protein
MAGTVLTGTDTGSISCHELQKQLYLSENCVIVPGSGDVFRKRFQELGIESYRGSGYGFQTVTSFAKNFTFTEFMHKGRTYIRVGVGSSRGFRMQMDESALGKIVDGTASTSSVESIRPSQDIIPKPEPAKVVVQAKNLHDHIRGKLRDALLNGNSSFSVVVNNDGLNSNRATKFCHGTVMEVLGSDKEGLGLAGHFSFKPQIFEMLRILCDIKLEGINEHGHLLYCGEWVGVQNLPGSDGQCGPLNGPQCEECTNMQRKAPANQALLLDISTQKGSPETLIEIRVRTTSSSSCR